MLRIHFISLFTICFVQYGISQIPTISSFAPASAPAGSTVLITGTNFSTIPGQNTVYFGDVKAVVTASSATSISTTVPAGASFLPIAVTVNNLTAFSANSFLISFGTGINFTASSFAPLVTVAQARLPCFGDFDNDGRIDIAAMFFGNKFQVFRNTGSIGAISYAAGTQYTCPTKPAQVFKKDFDGDGKLDLAVISNSSEVVAFYRNISLPDSIIFGQPVYFLGRPGEYPYSIDASDIDGDGKPDVVVGYVSSGSAFSVLRNTSTAGSISFANSLSFQFGSVPGASGNVGSNVRVFAKDIDGDGKPDVTSMAQYFPPFLIYRNTSTPGSISFAAKVSITTGRIEYAGLINYQLEDIDGDKKKDIVYTVRDSAKVRLLMNSSSPGNISFAPFITYNCVFNPSSLAVNDMDGDGKPELLLRYSDSLNIFKNTSTPGNILLNNQISYNPFTSSLNPLSINVADVDGDSKGDIVISENLQVLRNYAYSPVINSVIPILAVAGEPVTIKGSNFTAATAVLFGDSAAASFTVLSDSVIIAIVGNGASGYVTVSNNGGLSKYPGFSFSLPIPSITSFTPSAGPVGTTVVIEGKNFSPVLADNIVYFGSGRATVTAATDSSISVLAPAFNSYLPISITIGSRQLTAYSKIPFNTTFDSYVTSFSNANFGDSVNYATPGYPVKVTTADFDGDGKPEIAAANYFNFAGLTVHKNISTNGSTAFANRKDYATFNVAPGGNASGTVCSVTVDVDGDGKADMVAISNGANVFSTFRNKGTTDSINFYERQDGYAGENPVNITAADLDNDGRPDFAIANPYPSGRITVIKNISKPGGVSYASTSLEFLAGSVPQEILLEDFDNDGWIDMACTNFNDNNLSLFRNISTRGTIAFAERTSKITGTGPIFMAAADLNGDGKKDMLVGNSSSQTISIYKNISSAGNILFADKVDYTLPTTPAGLTVADLDGDGKVDVIAGNINYGACISLFKNNSTADSIILDSRVEISKTFRPATLFTTDVNGDGKPDILMGVNTGKKITILPNIIGNPVPVAVCPFADSTVFFANIPGTVYQWQQNTGAGFINIGDGINFSGTSTARLVLKNVPSSWYDYQYRCVVDGRNGESKVLKITAQWLGTVNSSWENPVNWGCGRLPDSNTDVFINSNTVVVNSNPTIRSLKIKSPALLTVNTGFNLTVLK